MKYSKTNNIVFVKFDKDEELVSTLNNFLREENINAGFFTAVGAIKNPSLGYFNTDTKVYEKKQFTGDFELISLNGNIGIANNELTTHIHIAIADSEFNTYGGHLFSTTVSVTVELFINLFPLKLERIYDSGTKLNLLSPCS